MSDRPLTVYSFSIQGVSDVQKVGAGLTERERETLFIAHFSRLGGEEIGISKWQISSAVSLFRFDDVCDQRFIAVLLSSISHGKESNDSR